MNGYVASPYHLYQGAGQDFTYQRLRKVSLVVKSMPFRIDRDMRWRVINKYLLFVLTFYALLLYTM